MSLDGFLTFTGLMIATFAILSPIGRLRLRLNLYRQIALGAVAIVLIGFFEFYFELRSIIPTKFDFLFKYVGFDKHTETLTHQEVAFLVVIAWMILALVMYGMAKPRAISLKTLSTLSEHLHDEGRYLELVKLVSPYLEVIKLATDKHPFNQPLYHRTLDTHQRAPSSILSLADTKKSRISKFVARRILPLASPIPSGHRAYQAASDIEDLLLKSDGIRQLLLRLKPDFVMALMDRQSRGADEFRTKYFQNSINDKASHYYRELRENKNLEGPFDYFLNPKNVLLTGFFGDAAVAEKYGIWKPIGDEVLRLISEDLCYYKRLNSPCRYDGDDLWSDPTFCAIHFFDIMVTTAAKQGVAYHMWLMYMSIIVSALEENHKIIDDRVILTDEFPTLGNLLIFKATHCHRNWISIATDLPDNNVHLNPDSLRGSNGTSIPYSATKDYIRAVRCIVKSKKLPKRFIGDQLESFIEKLTSLPQDGLLSCLRKQMINGLIDRDQSLYGDDLTPILLNLIEDVDHMVRLSAPDFMEELEKCK